MKFNQRVSPTRPIQIAPLTSHTCLHQHSMSLNRTRFQCSVYPDWFVVLQDCQPPGFVWRIRRLGTHSSQVTTGLVWLFRSKTASCKADNAPACLRGRLPARRGLLNMGHKQSCIMDRTCMDRDTNVYTNIKDQKKRDHSILMCCHPLVERTGVSVNPCFCY
jgi:hypothetical protein